MIILVKALITATIFLYIGYITKKESIHGKLFYSKWVLILGFICSLFLLILIYAFIINETDGDIRTYLAIALLAIFLGISSFACFAEYKITLGDYDKDGIHFCTPWSKCKQYKWSEITKVTYSDSWHWYVYHTSDNQKMRFSTYLTGIHQFIDYSNKKNIPFEI